MHLIRLQNKLKMFYTWIIKSMKSNVVFSFIMQFLLENVFYKTPYTSLRNILLRNILSLLIVTAKYYELVSFDILFRTLCST